jgi:hypothetical protein
MNSVRSLCLDIDCRMWVARSRIERLEEGGGGHIDAIPGDACGRHAERIALLMTSFGSGHTTDRI